MGGGVGIAPWVGTGGGGGIGSGNAPQIFVDGVYLYFGTSNLDGSWRQWVNGTDLVFERRESGVWVQKGAIPA
jgi:hypothetical protein